MTLILYLVVCLLVGITTFGGGQVFYVIFHSLFILILTPAVANDLVSATDWNWGLVFASVTPGPISTKMGEYLAILVSKYNIGISVIMVLASYLLITLPATVIMVMVDCQINSNSEKFQYIAKLLKPTVIAILLYLMLELIYSIANFDIYHGMKLNGSYSFIHGNLVEILKVSIYFIVDFFHFFIYLLKI
ncbi:MAG: chromate transporter [Mycoplasmataceae bacterium]|nr:chromate transporter [Mycoplasmataceae bacterium]